MMLGLTIYVAWSAKRRDPRFWWKKWGPTILTGFAGIFILADILRHVLQDTHVWEPGPWPGSSQYRQNCAHEDIACLSTVGVLFTVVFTYTGFIMLAAGTLWNANIIDKLKEIKKQWKQLRGTA